MSKEYDKDYERLVEEYEEALLAMLSEDVATAMNRVNGKKIEK